MPKDHLRNVEVRAGFLAEWEDVLWEWLHVSERCCRAWEWKDAPWWYGERASVSIFAAAVWNAGGIAFEEFAAEKMHQRAARKKRDTYSGRCDLYVKISKEKFIAEAKHTWSAAGKKAPDPRSQVEESLRRACEEAMSNETDVKNRLGIVFAIPYISTGYSKDLNSLLTCWTREITDVDYDAAAWIFPPEVRTSLISERGSYHPGGAVLIRKAR